jgi:hypothetical protein
MFRVQNKAKQDVSLGISLAVVLAKGDLLVAQSLDQNKIHNPPPPHRLQVPQWSLSLNGCTN